MGKILFSPVLRDMKEHIITSSFNSKKYQLDVLLPKIIKGQIRFVTLYCMF